MTDHSIVSRDQWLAARRRLLAKEKEFARMRDQLSSERRELPWMRVDKSYVFEGNAGKETLADLFAGRQQLIVYHFMFVPEWQAGCKSCSFWADNFNGIVAHLNRRDVSLAAVSRAPPATLRAFAARMGPLVVFPKSARAWLKRFSSIRIRTAVGRSDIIALRERDDLFELIEDQQQDQRRARLVTQQIVAVIAGTRTRTRRRPRRPPASRLHEPGNCVISCVGGHAMATNLSLDRGASLAPEHESISSIDSIELRMA